METCELCGRKLYRMSIKTDSGALCSFCVPPTIDRLGLYLRSAELYDDYLAVIRRGAEQKRNARIQQNADERLTRLINAESMIQNAERELSLLEVTHAHVFHSSYAILAAKTENALIARAINESRKTAQRVGSHNGRTVYRHQPQPGDVKPRRNRPDITGLELPL